MASESTPIIEILPIDILRAAYPGQAVLTTDQIANALAKTGKAGAQTIRNQIAAGTFPLSGKIKKVGGRNVLPMAAFADWLDGAEEAPSPKAPEKRRRGRPR